IAAIRPRPRTRVVDARRASDGRRGTGESGVGSGVLGGNGRSGGDRVRSPLGTHPIAVAGGTAARHGRPHSPTGAVHPRLDTGLIPRCVASPAHYTCAVFHLPRVNSHRVNSPTAVSDTNTPQNTPVCCQSSCSARYQHSGIWISQKNTRLILVGVTVSPAPLNACTATIHQPYTKNEYDRIRNHSPPMSITMASAVNSATSSRGNA